MASLNLESRLKMRSLSFLLALFFILSGSSYAWPSAGYSTLEVRKQDDGNSTSADVTKNALQKSCKKIRRLNALSQIANNQTLLDTWVAEGKLNTDEVDAIKAKAAKATTELQTLQSNTTLVSGCAIVNAERKSMEQCKQMRRLAKLAALAGNDTALAIYEQKKGLNETWIEILKQKAAEAQTKLQEMRSNTTLTDFCTQRQQQKNDGEFHVYVLYGSMLTHTVSDLDDAIADQAEQATGGAGGLTAKTMPLVLVPTLAALFTLFL